MVMMPCWFASTFLIGWMIQYVTGRVQEFHIESGSSPLAGVNKSAVRFRFSKMAALDSWDTPYLPIESHMYRLESDRGRQRLWLYTKTQVVNASIALCQLTNSAVRCSQKTNPLGSVFGSVLKLGNCTASLYTPANLTWWVNSTAIVLKLPVNLPTLKNEDVTCSLPSDSGLLNFTLYKIGCPRGYWGANCSELCNCTEPNLDCHTFWGFCVGRPVTRPTRLASPSPTTSHSNRSLSALPPTPPAPATSLSAVPTTPASATPVSAALTTPSRATPLSNTASDILSLWIVCTAAIIVWFGR